MKTSKTPRLTAWLGVLFLSTLAWAPSADAQRRGGGGAARPAPPQVNSGRADTRVNDVRAGSVNNVNVDGNAHVDCRRVGGCGGWDHPLAAAAVVGGAIASVGTVVVTAPTGCEAVNYGGIVYLVCAETWYAPYGSQWIVVDPPY